MLKMALEMMPSPRCSSKRAGSAALEDVPCRLAWQGSSRWCSGDTLELQRCSAELGGGRLRVRDGATLLRCQLSCINPDKHEGLGRVMVEGPWDTLVQDIQAELAECP